MPHSNELHKMPNFFSFIFIEICRWFLKEFWIDIDFEWISENMGIKSSVRKTRREILCTVQKLKDIKLNKCLGQRRKYQTSWKGQRNKNKKLSELDGKGNGKTVKQTKSVMEEKLLVKFQNF